MIQYLREFNFLSVCLRLVFALVAGGIVGYGRARKKETAGLRTYIITCVGSALTALISFYEYQMLMGPWSSLTTAELKFDGSRFSAAVISGIGFLAAGSIMLIKHQQVSGLTTAIGLFVTSCIGIAAGMGFYEAVVIAVVFIVVVMEAMHTMEMTFKRKMRNMTIHISFDDLEYLSQITDVIKNEKATIYEFELEDDSKNSSSASAIVWIRLDKSNNSHSSILSSIAELDCVSSVQELIS